MKKRKQAYGFVITLTPKQAYIFVNNDAFKHSENLEVIHETRFKNFQEKMLVLKCCITSGGFPQVCGELERLSGYDTNLRWGEYQERRGGNTALEEVI